NSFVLASANEHKVQEMRSLMTELDIVLLPRPADVAEIDETETTLEGNALLKAEAICRATGVAAIADDTGLFVHALEGRPGVFSARFAGKNATSHENVSKLLYELQGISEPFRGAYFRTVIAVSFPSGASWSVEGVLQGSILRAPVGDGGFGYDPIFAPTGLGGRSLGELSPDEKNALSHRARALRAFAATLVTS
ncbi:MAG: RdgB/HAM1 family non-canonical purine NTP pyrophosphatase, partial [Acidimicrobiales bacterium]